MSENFLVDKEAFLRMGKQTLEANKAKKSEIDALEQEYQEAKARLRGRFSGRHEEIEKKYQEIHDAIYLQHVEDVFAENEKDRKRIATLESVVTILRDQVSSLVSKAIKEQSNATD